MVVVDPHPGTADEAGSVPIERNPQDGGFQSASSRAALSLTKEEAASLAAAYRDHVKTCQGPEVRDAVRMFNYATGESIVVGDFQD